jgi:hypothetical protein
MKVPLKDRNLRLAYHRTYNISHYRDNIDYYKDKKKRRRSELRIWYKSLKVGLKCVDCGVVESEDLKLQWHHLNPDTKFKEISLMITEGYSKKRILEEMEKCVPLCLDCHVKRHDDLRSV